MRFVALTSVAALTVTAGLVVAASLGQRGATGADVLVRLRASATAGSADVIAAHGGKLVAREIDLWELPAQTAANTLATLERSDILFAEPEKTYAATVSSVEATDSLLDQEWWRAAVGVDGLTAPGPGVPVSIVDSGVDLGHPEFDGRPNLFTLNAQEPQPFGGVHGTSVASIVGAQENGVGVVGIYPNAVIRSWDAATGTGTELGSSEIASGILAAAQAGRSVINLSVGGSKDAAIEAAVDVAVAKGSLVVAAAGNDGTGRNSLSYPASQPHVLTVGATQPDGSVAPWSSTSRYVDLAAPGSQIPVATVDGRTGEQTWAVEDGTSFAAPLVAGAAAWIWTARPTLDAGQVGQLLRDSATDIDALGRDEASGFGLLNVPRALSLPAPARDQNEPNDDADDVTPGRDGYHDTPALTGRGKTSSRMSGRVDEAEDPRDVYRVWVPKGQKLVARITSGGGIAVALYRSDIGSIVASPAKPLANGKATGSSGVTLTYRNTVAGRFALLVVRPTTANTTSYVVGVRAQ